MPITPTNQVKHSITPNRTGKGGVYLWGDDVYTWGDATATWGSLISYINRDKSTLATYLELEDGSQFLLENGSLLEMEGGSGALVWINQDKN